MSSSGRKVRVLASFAVLLGFAAAVGCNGFFVDPVLTSISVQTLQSTNLPNVGSTVQLQATGTYDDNSHKNLTGTATWSVTTNPSFVSVQGGLVTALQVVPAGTQAVVQAAKQSSNGTVVSGTLTVTVGQVTTLTIVSSLGNTISLASHPAGQAISFTASLNGTDKTGSTTFTSNNSSIINVSSSGSGTIGGTTGTCTITGTDSADSATGTLQITVTQ
jgi:uncharacterized surface anchored protein